MLFVILHELGHAAITEMGLPVLGRTEDAADSFAAVGLIKIGSNFTDQVLSEAARGWFLDDRRDQATNETVVRSREAGLPVGFRGAIVGVSPHCFRDPAAALSRRK
jgi:hypothetical protein